MRRCNMAISVIERIARNLISTHNWRRDQAEECILGWGKIGPFWFPTMKKVCKLSPTTLGVIAITGSSANFKTASLYNVHQTSWLDEDESGKEILRTLATTALLCKIYDLLLAEPEQVHILTANGDRPGEHVIISEEVGELKCTKYYFVRADGVRRQIIASCNVLSAVSLGWISLVDAAKVSVLPGDFWKAF